MHACIHAYIHTCMHAYMHTYIYTYIHTCMHAYMHTYIYTYIHTADTNIHGVCVVCVCVHILTPQAGLQGLKTPRHRGVTARCFPR